MPWTRLGYLTVALKVALSWALKRLSEDGRPRIMDSVGLFFRATHVANPCQEYDLT